MTAERFLVVCVCNKFLDQLRDNLSSRVIKTNLFSFENLENRGQECDEELRVPIQLQARLSVCG
jgi:hypothetical protein